MSRREERLPKPAAPLKLWALRNLLHPMNVLKAAEFPIDKAWATQSNAEFFDSMRRGRAVARRCF